MRNGPFAVPAATVTTTNGGVVQFTILCPTPVPADFDLDCDVDHDDYLALDACASGPTVPFAAGCDAKDLDPDGDVDQADFAAFQRCYSGEGVPAGPNCRS